MAVTLNHAILHVRNKSETGDFLARLMGLDPSRAPAHFLVVQIGETSLDLIETDGEISPRHFAVLVSEAEFDTIFARLRDRGIPYWADPFHHEPGAINHWDDGRGVYFDDPDGHLLEIITRSYGSGGHSARNPNPLLGRPA